MKQLIYILPDKNWGVASVVRNLLRFKTDRFRTKVLLIHNNLDDASLRVNDDFAADEIIRISYNGKWSSSRLVMTRIISHINKDSILIANDGGIDLELVRYLKMSIPIVYIMHGDFVHYYNSINERGHLIDVIITVSDYLKERVKSNLKHSHFLSETEVVSLKFPVPLRKQDGERRKRAKAIRLSFVGLLAESKGVMFFKTILNELVRLGVNFTFNIIGDGPLEEDLKEDLQCFPEVHFLGRLTNQEVISCHAQHDILILPSYGEGLPVSVVEAMGCGVVPITSDLKSGIPELIEDTVTGFTVPLGQEKQYSKIIKYLDDNREEMDAMGERCIRKVNSKFDPYVQAKAYEEVFIHSKPYSKSMMERNIIDFLPITVAHRINKLKQDYGM